MFQVWTFRGFDIARIKKCVRGLDLASRHLELVAFGAER